jgi:transcriptional regulator with XRE-family HTH domain
MQRGREALKRSAFLRALGAAMRARRVRLKLTIVEVAARLGEPAVAVLRLEEGARNVSVLRLAAAARALDISLPDLVKLAERRMRRDLRTR